MDHYDYPVSPAAMAAEQLVYCIHRKTFSIMTWGQVTNGLEGYTDQYFPTPIEYGQKTVRFTKNFEEYKGQPREDWKDHTLNVTLPWALLLRKRLKGERFDALWIKKWED